MIAYMVLTPVVAVVVSFASCRLRLCENNIGIAPSQQYSKAVFVVEKWPICGVTVGLAIG